MNIPYDLVLEAQKGEAKATTSIFKELFGMLVQRGISLGVTDESEDAASVALAKVFERMGSMHFESAGRFVSWVYEIHHNYTVDLLRKRDSRKRRHAAWFQENSPSDLANPRRRCEVRDDLRHVLGFLSENLSPKTRVMLGLDMIGCTNPEIADRTGYSLPAVKAKLFRAKRKLNQLYSSE